MTKNNSSFEHNFGYSERVCYIKHYSASLYMEIIGVLQIQPNQSAVNICSLYSTRAKRRLHQ